MLLVLFAVLLNCPTVRPSTSSHEGMVKTVASKPPRSVKSQVGRVPALDNFGGATQDEVGLETEQDDIADLLNAPDRDIHSQTHLSGIESGTVPSLPLYVYAVVTHCVLLVVHTMFGVPSRSRGLCSSDYPNVFATASLHVSQGKPLHDDIMPEVAEELGPGGHCMAAYPCALIHLQQTYCTYRHKQIHSYMLTTLYIRTYIHKYVCIVYSTCILKRCLCRSCISMPSHTYEQPHMHICLHLSVCRGIDSLPEGKAPCHAGRDGQDECRGQGEGLCVVASCLVWLSLIWHVCCHICHSGNNDICYHIVTTMTPPLL